MFGCKNIRIIKSLIIIIIDLFHTHSGTVDKDLQNIYEYICHKN